MTTELLPCQTMARPIHDRINGLRRFIEKHSEGEEMRLALGDLNNLHEYCDLMYAAYRDEVEPHLPKNLRPAPSADAVGTRQLMVDLVNAMSAKMLLQSGEVRAWDNRAMPLLKAFRQQTWAAAIEMAAEECERHARFCKDEAHKGGDFKHLITRCDEATHNAERIRSLTPLERKEG